MGPHRLSACLAFILVALSPAAQGVPTIAGCPMFPADNYWNTRVDNLPLHPSSAAWVNSVGVSTRLHPDWSNVLADGYGFTPATVNSAQQGVPITFTTAQGESESDPGPYPIPPALATPGGDREVVVLETTNCILFELYGAPSSGGGWIAASAAKFDVRSNALRPDGHSSLDQAGLPVLQGLMRWEEVAAGEIAHAIRFTATNAWGRVALPGGGTAMKYLWPARHGSGDSTDETFPPMGARFRLKASFDITGFDPRTQIVLRAFKKYGLVLSSRGGNWFLQGVSDANWPDSVIDDLRSIAGGNFEVVDTAPMMVNVNSGQAVQLAAPPEQTLELSGIGQIAAGYSYTCALTTAGGAKCWGDNQFGELGDGTTTRRLTPVDVSGLASGAAAITKGYAHTCALTTAGGVKCWGDNGAGQLGDNSTTQRHTPVDVSGLGSGVAAITTGYAHTCALTTAGGVKCWGDNPHGELGDGTTTRRLTSVDVSGLGSGVAAIAAGWYHTCALTTAGGVKCWGDNGTGQVGNNSSTQQLVPVDVSGLASGVAAITAGSLHTCALTTGGGVKCWGRNDFGGLGDNSVFPRYTPIDVSGLASGVAAITAGFYHSCALTTGGGVKCWGGNEGGQLGDNSTTQRLTPVAVLASGSASVPDAPTIVSVIPGSGQVSIAFTAPASDGGSPITSYTVTCNPGNLTATGSSSPITVTGLASGTSYSCSVTAIHASGPGTASSSVTVTLGVIVADDAFPPGGVPSGWMQPAGSNAAWVVANDAAYAGSLSLKSGFIGHNQKSEIAYTANFAAGNVTFARKVSSQPTFDALQFHIDGVLQATWSGEQDWSVLSFPISAGAHTLMWRYVKDGSISSGGDAAWIDSVVLPAAGQCRLLMPNRRCVTD